MLRVTDLTAAWALSLDAQAPAGGEASAANNQQAIISRQSGVARDRTHGVALPRCSDGSGCAVSDEGATAYPFLGAYRVQLELSVRTTLRNQRLAALVSGAARLPMTVVTRDYIDALVEQRLLPERPDTAF